MAGAFDDFDPTGAKQPVAAAPKQALGGAFSDFNPTGAKQGQQPPPPPQATSGGPSQPAAPGGAPQPSGWGVSWPSGNVTMPQSFQDWGTVANNEQLAGSIQALRAQAALARQRLGPVAAGTADVVGNVLSPTTLAYGIPYFGPGIAGGLHEGIKSYAAGNDPKTILEDAAAGAGEAYLGVGAAKLAPKVLPPLARAGITVGGPLGMGWAGHTLFGHGDLYREVANAGTELSAMPGWNELGKRVQGPFRGFLSSPVTQQAIKSLTLGGGSAFRQQAGPWDQWIPGQ